MDDVRLGSGDVELEAFDGSRIAIQKATMTQAPFRVVAPNGSVRISDSILRLGVPSERYNFFATPHDVIVENSTLVASERIDDTDTEAEAEHVFSIATVRFQTLAHGSSEGANDPAPDELAAPPHRLLLERCHFALGGDVEANDRVFAAANTSNSVGLEVRGGTLGPGVVDWFEPGCVNCVHTP